MMLVWELVLIIAVAGIFIVSVRRLPVALRTMRQFEPETTTPSALSVTVSSSTPEPVVLPTPPPEEEKVLKLEKKVARPFERPRPVEQEKVDLPPTFDDGERRFKDQDYEEAARIFQGLAKEEPADVKIRTRLGNAYMAMERFVDARDEYRAALKLDEQTASRHANVGLAEYALGHRLTALRYLKRALALAPDNKQYQQLLETVEIEEG